MKDNKIRKAEKQNKSMRPKLLLGVGKAGSAKPVHNYLADHDFNSSDTWERAPMNCIDLNIMVYECENCAEYGKKLLRMQSFRKDQRENGIYQTTAVLTAGEYTFSAFLKITSAFTGTERPGAYLRVMSTDGYILAESAHLKTCGEKYIRRSAKFTLRSAQSVRVYILADGKGTVYADAAQLEDRPDASAYNLLDNGKFRRRMHLNESCCKEGFTSYMPDGCDGCDPVRCVYQTVPVKSSRGVRETFTLSARARNCSDAVHTRYPVRDAKFRLRAVVKYADIVYRQSSTEEYSVSFSPCAGEWQYASVRFAKKQFRPVQSLTVFCDCGYDCGTVCFDDMRLVRSKIETELSAEDFPAAGDVR